MNIQINVFVSNEEQYNTVLKYPVERIYSNDFELVKKHPEIYFEVPRYKHSYSLPERLLVNDVGTLLENQGKLLVTNYSLNVANKEAIHLLKQYKIDKITLSLECGLEELKFFDSLEEEPIEVIIYGRAEVMILKEHPLWRKNGYELEDYQGKRYPIIVENSHHVHILNYDVINKLADIPKYYDLGIRAFRLQFTLENEEEIETLLSNIFS